MTFFENRSGYTMTEWILIITLAAGTDGGSFVKDIPGFPSRESCSMSANFWNEQWFKRRSNHWTDSYVRASGFAVCVERPSLRRRT